jgi:hypothetical protein
MTTKNIIINGKISNKSNNPLSNLRIEAWDKDFFRDDFVGETISDKNGNFKISFTEKRFTELFLDNKPDIYFKIYANDKQIHSTENSVLWNATNSQRSLEIIIDAKFENIPDATDKNSRKVYGELRNEFGALLKNVTVQVFDRDLRNEELLGTYVSKDGKYLVSYHSGQFRKSEKDAADILVKILDKSGRELYKSVIFYNAPDSLEVNITLNDAGYKGKSEWEVLTETFDPLIEGLSPLELREDEQFQDISFLAGESGKSEVMICTWIFSHHLFEKTTIERTPIEAAVFFAFLRQGQPVLLSESLVQDMQDSDRVELLKDKILRELSAISRELQQRIMEKGITDNTIPTRIIADLDKVLEALRIIKLHYAADNTIGAGKGTINQLLELTPAAAKEKLKFIAAFNDHTGSINDFWKKLVTDKIFKPEVVKEVKLNFQLGTLTRNHIPLVEVLNQQFKNKELSSKRELAKLDSKGWIKIFKMKGADGKPVGVPDNIDGETEKEKYEEYGAILENRLERAYATTAFMAKLDRTKKTSITAKNEIVSFLDNNPLFYMDRFRIDHYVSENKEALRNIKNKDEVIKQLKSIQRLFKLKPTYQAVETLLNRKIESAQQIYFMGREQFVTTLKDTGINKIESKKLYYRAENTYAYSLNLYANFNNRLKGPGLAAAPSFKITAEEEEKIKAIPNLQTLFGSLDFCECTHCRSVYSPAAHFVDIMRFLGERNTNGTEINAGKKVKHILLDRRADLGEMELSCENTNTPLPYIDLVNEILEDVVSPPQATVLNAAIETSLTPGGIKAAVKNELIAKKIPIDEDGELFNPDSRGHWSIRDKMHSYKVFKTSGTLKILPTKQTHFNAAEARANPEYTNAKAYDKLSTEVYPFNLPFNLWFLQSRTYLDHLGVSQPKLFELFQQKLSDNITFEPSDIQVNRAWLGINEAAGKIITNSYLPEKKSWDFWGLQQNGNNLPHPDTPTDPTTNITGGWVTVLSNVSVMLHRSGLNYKELLQLLDMLYVNPTKSIVINDNVDSNAAICDATKFKIAGLTVEALDRMHRFLRLWRKLGCTMWELDLLLPAGDPLSTPIDKQLTDPVIEDISRMNRIKENFGWDWSMVLALFNPIGHSIYYDRSKSDAQVVQTLYQRLFRNKLVDATAVFPESPTQISGAIKGNGTEDFPDKIPGILAAFRISEDDLNIILKEHLGLTVDSTLNWEVLSQLYRVTILAKASGLSTDQFIRLKKLWSIDPFASSKATLDFIELTTKILNSGFTVTELDYLLAHQYKINSGVALENKTIVAIIKEIRDGLQKVEDDIILKTEETAEAYIKSKLGLLPVFAKDIDQDKALAIINGTWTDTATEKRDDLIDLFFSDVLDLTVAKTNFADIPPGGTGMSLEDRLDYFQPALQNYLLQTGKETFIKQKIAETFQVEVPSADLLLSQLKVSGSTASLLENLNDLKLLEKLSDGIYKFDIDETNFLSGFKSLKLLYKDALVINKLKMKTEELKWWLSGTHTTNLNWPHPKDFPIESGSMVLLSAWNNMSDFFEFKNKLPKSELTAFEYLDIILNPAIVGQPNIAALSKFSSWKESDIDALVKAFRWDAKIELHKSQSLIRLHNCIQSLLRLGIDAQRAIDWAKAIPTAEIAESMKQTIKAKYDLPQWQKVIQPLQDIFREQKRDALVSWLTSQTNPNWIDQNALYSYFLIDVEMSACMLTSRLKQAAASAQLFVQRCLMNLELDIAIRSEKTDSTDTLADSKWKQWKWMKYYRVWEANRKVFLYPENWIEPELRDEKSPFFKELENELMQNDISNDTAEEAFLNYLEKLDQVANLEIRTIYNEVISSNEEVLHVFGRTRSSLSPDYFYRKRINKGRWTAWEKIDLEIAGNHLVAGIHNRRLHLFWPQFLEKATEPTTFAIPTANSGGNVSAPSRFWEIRMFWSELKKGKWKPKVLSDTFLKVYQTEAGGNYPQNINFRTRLKPYIQVKLFNSFRPYDFAPLGNNYFNKIGRQMEPDSSGEEYENLITAPETQYFYGLTKYNTNKLYFYYSASQYDSYGDYAAATDSTNATEVLKKLTPYSTYTVLNSTARFFSNSGSFFMWDPSRTYFVDYNINKSQEYISQKLYTRVTKSFSFFVHYHPFVELFTKELNIWGIKGLLNRRIQVNPKSIPGSPSLFNFADYNPTSVVSKTYELPDKTKSYPVEDVDFSYKGAYALYNWELFFHAPFHIANKLATNQRFEEALEWFHYIFNPTNTDNAVNDPNSPQQKYWITKPFYETTKNDYYKQKIETLLLSIAKGESETIAQVNEWRDNPFNPHLIARMRTVAYQKSVLIKYIQTIIAWGDQLFRQNTIETINEATQLYVLADSVLGPRPKSIPKKVNNSVKTYYQLEGEGIDIFGNALMEVENLLPPASSSSTMGDESPELPRLDVMYFCIPNNEKLISMWDLVEDRLFKIRHCMNIDGMVQQLPLFDPPIDPGALVKAAAGGLDLSSVLAEMNAPMPLYRFNFMIQKAFELCTEVKSLGAAMLSALEKKDGEAFNLLRTSHELTMLDAVRSLKMRQIEESLKNWEGIIEGKKIVEERKAYYTKLINDGWNAGELTAFGLSTGSAAIEVAVATAYILSGGLKLIPTFLAGAAGFGGTPEVSASMGGQQIGNGAEMAARTLQSIASALDKSASLISTASSFGRRADDWDFQKRLAEKELPQVDKQIAAAEIRKQMADIELANHDRQKENLEKEREYMLSKFTNQELYDWMINQLSTVYFQSYQLAFDIAKRAERCFRYELGLSDSNYIQFGYWDSLKKGLLSGEKLFYDLKRLEAAYYEQNRREYELTKHISLSQIDPVALLKLRQNGECLIDIPETVFDMDYPGHYFRRIKSVSVSIPCITGPYTTIACTLSLNRNSIRKNSLLSGGKYERDFAIDDLRFQDEVSTIQSIATSGAQNDSGMFELNFRDERYLPFEGAGVISSWQLKLNSDFLQFDLNTISDIVIHLNYTAREGGEALKNAAVLEFNKKLNSMALAENSKGLFRVYDIRKEFSTEWNKFLFPAVVNGEQQLILENLQERLPYFTQNFKFKKVSKIEVVALAKDDTKTYKVMVSPLGNTDTDLLNLAVGSQYQGLHNSSKDLTGNEVNLNSWTIKIKENGVGDFKSLATDAVKELFLIINYAIS